MVIICMVLVMRTRVRMMVRLEMRTMMTLRRLLPLMRMTFNNDGVIVVHDGECQGSNPVGDSISATMTSMGACFLRHTK